MENDKQLLFLKRRSSEGLFRDRLGILVSATLLFHSFMLIGLFFLYGAYSRLANKPAPSLVQTSSGESFPVLAVGSRERTPETIKTFTLETLTMLFTWTGNLPTEGSNAEEFQQDPGVEVDGGRITSPASAASYALSQDFREEIRNKLGELTPNSVFTGRSQVFFEPLNISEPVRIAEGEWRVSVVANLIVIGQNNDLVDQIPFNKELLVRSVEVPHLWEGSSILERKIASVRGSGLEIYQMRDL